MTIESTAPPQARHKPRAQKRSKTTEQQPDKEALLLIDSEPAISSDGDDWYYFWYKVPGQKQNANSNGNAQLGWPHKFTPGQRLAPIKHSRKGNQ